MLIRISSHFYRFVTRLRGFGPSRKGRPLLIGVRAYIRVGERDSRPDTLRKALAKRAVCLSYVPCFVPLARVRLAMVPSSIERGYNPTPMAHLSVILSIFDQPQAFTYSLLGYQRQTFRDFEVVVADDGSDEETRAIVEEFRRTSGVPTKHVWQENRGYRRAKIANEAVRASEGKVLLLSDGDCIPHRDFVRVHAEGCVARSFCTGGYVRLSPEYCPTLTRESVLSGAFEAQMTPEDRWRFRITHWKSRWGVLWGNMRKPKVYGCNISVDREVYYAVNGYDENFDGFGKEDSDLRNRFRRYGAKPVSLWGKAWVYHVDDVIDPKIRRRRVPRSDGHPYYERPAVPVRCLNGIVKDGS